MSAITTRSDLTRRAPVESVQSEHAVDGVQFGRLDEFRVHNGNCEQGLCVPKTLSELMT